MKEKQEWGSRGEEKQKIRLKRRWSMRRSTKVKTEGGVGASDPVRR